VILAFAVLMVVCVQGVAVAEQLPMTHKCMVYEPNYCATSEYYDQWEERGGNYLNYFDHVLEDDPCDLGYYHLAKECDWTGEPFQDHKWMLGVVELLASEPVNRLGVAAVTPGHNGEENDGKEIIGTTVRSIACREGENCMTQYSWVQTTVLTKYTNDHAALEEGYDAECVWNEAFERPLCPGRKLWGFEGQGEY
jgi:hypothetical protein